VYSWPSELWPKHDWVTAFELVSPLVRPPWVYSRPSELDQCTRLQGTVLAVAYLDVRAALHWCVLHDKNTCFGASIFTFLLHLSGNATTLLLSRYSKLQRSLPWYTAGELAELALIVG
jgi:hypothetical protein